MKKTIPRYIYLFALSAGIIIFVFYLLTNYLILLINPSAVIRFFIFLIAAAISALLITIGAMAFDPILWEAVFFSRRLHRFESLSNPLLLKLSVSAPGTYHHSINVSNLAQKAAKAVGADTLLVRTAAYYHDIGKLIDAKIYIENQAESEIPTELNSDSIKQQAELIISHIRAGVELAEKNHLPEEIIDLICEHHGTTRVLYFYEKAKENKIKIKKTDFRYVGPKPLSRESAILMLADSVEAAVRAQPQIKNVEIKDIIDAAVSEKISDKQLINSRLSADEIEKIKKSFETTLLSIYHQRIYR